ncbi:hypothetical protein QIS74_02031 [Colletotrichum tabaci]|uniref:Uncharacterized protein n=1 Tax=Colletotrichum tabaci TaxID=1209068 RepID=A0AAV9TRQ5_9PEZI
MCTSYPSPGADKATRWELSSGGSSPRSDTSTNMNSLFSSPDSPADTELSFPSIISKDTQNTAISKQSGVCSTASMPNHILAGHTLYAPGQIRAMCDIISSARKTGEFPNTTSPVEDPQTIVEDYQLLHGLREARGDPAIHPPPQKYNILKVDIARRIKARDEAHGGSSNLQEMDHRVQNWMNSINKEARMLEITQAALQRKGINNPTQDDLDAIAEEFMQIAERTLLDVANPLRMNATRMEGNISRFDSQLNGFDGAMTVQLNALNSVMTSQLSTLNTVLGAQSNTFNGSITMLNTALGTVSADLQQLTSNLPALIATAVQAAVQEHMTSVSQHNISPQHQTNIEKPPGYATATRSQQHQQSAREVFTGFTHSATTTSQVSRQQQHEQNAHLSTSPSKSKFKKFFRCIMGKGRSERKEEHKQASSV